VAGKKFLATFSIWVLLVTARSRVAIRKKVHPANAYLLRRKAKSIPDEDNGKFKYQNAN